MIYPKVSPGGGALSGVPCQSAVSLKTVFPHHCWIVVLPISPFLGY